MKLQRSTVVLLASALLLGGVVLLTQTRQANRPTTAQGETATPVYEFEEEEAVGLHIETQTQEVTFQRDETGFWQMTHPEAQPAEAAAIAFLLSRLTTNGLLQTIDIDAANQAEFGLDIPFATVEITLQDDTTHTLVLGDADFSGQNSYALIDPETIPLSDTAGEVTVALVSDDIINGVDRPIEEWIAVVESPETTTVDETGDTDEADTDASETSDDSEADETSLPDADNTETAEPEPAEGEPAEEDTSEDIEIPIPETELIPAPAPENADPSE
ncbi:MAG: DUF4340 domain-containing protein [Leptolyngbya sp. SIO1D8]|nr:DUF4340 domain-containing protein [Leptolyngbya sp. SIO1D8]